MNQTQADSNTGSISKRVLEWNADGDQDVGFQTGTLSQIATADQSLDTDAIFFAVFNNTNGITTGPGNATLSLFREERDGSDAIWFMNISGGGVTSASNFTHRPFFLDYKDSLVPVTINWTVNTSDPGAQVSKGQIIIDFDSDWGVGADPAHGTDMENVTIWFQTKSVTDPNSIDYLGTADGTEDTYLFYGTNDISYYKANIVVTTGGRTVGGEGGDVVTDEAQQIQTASDVTDLTKFNAILGGG